MCACHFGMRKGQKEGWLTRIFLNFLKFSYKHKKFHSYLYAQNRPTLLNRRNIESRFDAADRRIVGHAQCRIRSVKVVDDPHHLHIVDLVDAWYYLLHARSYTSQIAQYFDGVCDRWWLCVARVVRLCHTSQIAQFFVPFWVALASIHRHRNASNILFAIFTCHFGRSTAILTDVLPVAHAQTPQTHAINAKNLKICWKPSNLL